MLNIDKIFTDHKVLRHKLRDVSKTCKYILCKYFKTLFPIKNIGKKYYIHKNYCTKIQITSFSVYDL